MKLPIILISCVFFFDTVEIIVDYNTKRCFPPVDLTFEYGSVAQGYIDPNQTFIWRTPLQELTRPITVTLWHSSDFITKTIFLGLPIGPTISPTMSPGISPTIKEECDFMLSSEIQKY